MLVKGNGSGAATFDELPDYDNALDTWGNYEWVYPNESDTIIEWSALYNLTNFVMNSTDYAFYSQYNTIFDVANLVDYYLFINVLKAMDNMGRNLFLARYKKSGAFFYVPWDLDAIWGLDAEGEQTHDAIGLLGNGFYARLLDDCSDNGFANMARDRYNALRETILNREHIMALVQEQYDWLVENGVFEKEHEAWPEFMVDEGQLDYMSDWLDQRFAYLDEEINAACGTWSINDSAEPQAVEVFPNPARDQINILLPVIDSAEVFIRLYDMTGRLVYSASGTASSMQIPTHGLRAGVYTVLVNVNGQVQVNRVVVQPII